MPFKYRKKIRLKKPSHLERRNPKLELDLKNIHKTLDIKETKISKPKDLTEILVDIKHKFTKLVVPFISGEYKKENKRVLVYDNVNKTIKLRYQLMSLKDHLSEFIFQLRGYVISHSDDKEKIEKIEKEIKEWEKIINKTVTELIDNVSFVIEHYFVPIFNKLEKKEKTHEN